MPNVTITHDERELVIQGDTIGKRVKENFLRRALRVKEHTDPLYRDTALYAVIYLSYVQSGDIGLAVPTEDDDMATVTAFLDAFMRMDDSLLNAIDDAIVRTRVVTNDPDLLPPGEVDKSKKKTPKSKSDD